MPELRAGKRARYGGGRVPKQPIQFLGWSRLPLLATLTTAAPTGCSSVTPSRRWDLRDRERRQTHRSSHVLAAPLSWARPTDSRVVQAFTRDRIFSQMPRAGLEPATRGLEGRGSSGVPVTKTRSGDGKQMRVGLPSPQMSEWNVVRRATTAGSRCRAKRASRLSICARARPDAIASSTVRRSNASWRSPLRAGCRRCRAGSGRRRAGARRRRSRDSLLKAANVREGVRPSVRAAPRPTDLGVEQESDTRSELASTRVRVT
jgi:hypothetical protein